MKKIVLLALFMLVPVLLGSVSAEKEFTKAGLFNISFEMNAPHEIIKEIEDGIEDGIYIRTLDGDIAVEVNRDKSGTSNLDAFIKIEFPLQSSVKKLQIDGKDARLITLLGPGGYVVLYYPRPGWCAMITSDLSTTEIPDFFKTLHIEPI